MTLLKSLTVAVIAIFMGASAVLAQGQAPPEMPDLPTSADVSDEEITQLVNAINELEPIQMKMQEKIEDAVEAEEISFDRFQQMMMAMQNPQMADQVEISDEEMDKLQTLQPKLMEIQMEAEEEMIEKVEENGLTAERYQEIMMGAQQDEELRNRVQERLENG